jgi:molybdate/tungstate transport system substrate-binding protein
MNDRYKLNIFYVILTLIYCLACIDSHTFAAQETSPEKLIIFHAGSLTIPFKELGRAFTRKYPGIKIQSEGAGSRTCARKITDLHKPCDIMASADYTVIENLLIPEYTDWNISFATNEMAIMYRPDSAHADTITSNNWPEILLMDDVEYGHSDPNADPCGYRTQLTWQLAEKYYKKNGLYEALQRGCPAKNIRPKETDLIALLESGELDYLFIYRSICEQHQAPCLELPVEINLKSTQFSELYKQASIEISGKKPGTKIKKGGKPMVYGITIPHNAPHPKAAALFIAFLTSQEGRAIMAKNGQPPLWPVQISGRADLLPKELQSLE